MVKIVLILLHVLFVSSAVFSTRVTVGGKDFTHIGRFTSRRSIQEIDEFDYFISVVPNTWTGAENECPFFFGENATLVAIESVEEWDFLKVKLESFGSVYWTGGMYFPQSRVWGWAANSQKFPPFAPWDQGHPTANPTPLHRVSIAHWSRHLAFWRSVPYTELYPYICEIQRETRAVDCYNENDLIIVLDSSGSIGSGNYSTTLSFVERLASAFTVYEPSRLAFIIFSDVAQLQIHLTNSYSREFISRTILDTPYMDSGTATWLGIDLAIAQFDSSPRDIPLNMVILTDGMSNDEALTIASAQRATARGIRMFSVGITDATNPAELLVLAGGIRERVFSTDTFDELINLLAPVSLTVCSEN
ncbi:hypothetical protein HA402_015494 [Bradysia odoriphaga]|nr:hypothetical protein HA402_015494 [Bradysia odoriphaga]